MPMTKTSWKMTCFMFPKFLTDELSSNVRGLVNRKGMISKTVWRAFHCCFRILLICNRFWNDDLRKLIFLVILYLWWPQYWPYSDLRQWGQRFVTVRGVSRQQVCTGKRTRQYVWMHNVHTYIGIQRGVQRQRPDGETPAPAPAPNSRSQQLMTGTNALCPGPGGGCEAGGLRPVGCQPVTAAASAAAPARPCRRNNPLLSSESPASPPCSWWPPNIRRCCWYLSDFWRGRWIRHGLQVVTPELDWRRNGSA